MSRLDATEAGWEESAALEVAFTELMKKKIPWAWVGDHGKSRISTESTAVDLLLNWGGTPDFKADK